MTLFGTSTAEQTYHQWLTFNVTRPTSNTARIEGADASFGDLTQPSRVGNITQIITRPIRVSRTERRVSVAGMSDPFIFQKAEGLRALKMDMEYAVLNSTTASGSSGVARQMVGLDASITSKLLWRLICSIIETITWRSKTFKTKLLSVLTAARDSAQELVIRLGTINTVPGYVL